MITAFINYLNKFHPSSYPVQKAMRNIIRFLNNLRLLVAIYRDSNRKCIIVGTTTKGLFYARLLNFKKKLYGICCISEPASKTYYSLFDIKSVTTEEIPNIDVLLFEKYHNTKNKGILFELGFQDSQIHIMDHVAKIKEKIQELTLNEKKRDF